MPETNWIIAGIALERWLLALLITIGVYLVASVSIRFVANRLGEWSKRTEGRADDVLFDVVSHTNPFLIFLAALLMGLGVLGLPEKWAGRLPLGWTIVLSVQLALWANRAIRIWMGRYPASATVTTLTFILRAVVWVIVLLTILSNLGVNITAFVASLGIGGIAIALAVQNILSDLFASLSIALDKPFETGDFIISGELLGTVEYIGIKTTRIRSLSGEQVVISNAELLKRLIRNYKRMSERRALFNFGVTYNTPVEQLEALPDIVKKIIDGLPETRFDRAHFAKFGADSLDFEVVYYMLQPDYNLFMDAQQRINLELMRACAAHGIDFAFPTRTLHIASVPDEVKKKIASQEKTGTGQQEGEAQPKPLSA
jgi:small-conductance mechanosensitive channel